MYDQRLIKRLLAPQPNTVALVGESVFRVEAELLRASAETDNSQTQPVVYKTAHIPAYIEDSKATERNIAQCVMCMDISDHGENPESLLGLACRASPKLLLVEQTTAETSDFMVKDEQFFAFGFRVVEKITESGVQRALYSYSLSEYKQAPDWLNAKFWARPERFDLPE